jgi:pimeloyl-ACP methyl ester carboxylesterase
MTYPDPVAARSSVAISGAGPPAVIEERWKPSQKPLAAFLTAGSVPALAASTKNIVLVHGAWVDGSGWKSVYEILVRDGYHVSLVQEPLTSLDDDVAATKRIIELQPGPCILVAHSYGGTVITEAGTDPHVVGLVFIAAHEPDAGETEASNGKRLPSATSGRVHRPCH